MHLIFSEYTLIKTAIILKYMTHLDWVLKILIFKIIFNFENNFP